MNGIDVCIIIVILFFVIKGLMKGLFIEALTLVGLVLAIIVSVREANTAALIIRKMIDMPEWLSLSIGSSVLFAIITIGCRILAGFLQKTFRRSMFAWVDKGGGVLFGLCKGVLLASLFAFVVALIPVKGDFVKMQDKSLMFHPIRKITPSIFNVCKFALPQTDDFYDEIKQAMQNRSKKLQDQLIQKKLEELKNGLPTELTKQHNESTAKLLKQVEQMQK